MTFEDRNSHPHEWGDWAIARIASRQHSVFTYEQALEVGITPSGVSRRVRAGRWGTVLPRVYRVAGAPTSGRQACMAAVLWAGEEALVSHRTAGVLWALDGVTGRRVEVTVRREFDRRSPLVVVHRTARRLDTDRHDLDGIAITSPARTLIDLAGVLPPRLLELAVEDAFRRQLTSPDELVRDLQRVEGRGRAGCATLRLLLEERGETTDSKWEVRLRRLLVDHGLPVPFAQYPVVVDGRTFELDLAYPDELVDVEFDSLRWHTGRERLEADSTRRNLLRGAGWQIVHVTARMLREQPEHVVQLVRDALRVDVSVEDRQ